MSIPGVWDEPRTHPCPPLPPRPVLGSGGVGARRAGEEVMETLEEGKEEVMELLVKEVEETWRSRQRKSCWLITGLLQWLKPHPLL